MLAKKVLRGGVWLLAMRLSSNFLSIAATFIIARILSPEDFGIVAIATTIQVILYSVTEVSTTQALIYEKNVDKRHLDTAWTLSLLRGLLVFTTLAIFSDFLAHYFNTPALKLILLALGAGVLVKSLSSPALVLFQKDLNFKQEFLVIGLAKLASFTGSVWVAYTYESYWAIVIGLLLSDLVHFVVSYIVAPYFPVFNLSKLRTMMSFSGWITLSNVVNTLNWNFDNLFVGKIIGEKALGLYKMGNTIALIPSRELTTPLRQLLFPGFSLLVHDNARVRSAYQRSQTLTSFIVMPGGIGLACVAGMFVPLALGEQWSGVVSIVQVLAVVFAVQSLATLVNPLAMSFGKTKTLFFRDLLLFAIRLPLVFICAIEWGLEGIVWARVVSGALAIAIGIGLVKSTIGYGYMNHLLDNWRTFAGCAVMAVVTIMIQSSLALNLAFSSRYWMIGVTILFGAVSYFATVYFLWYMCGKPQSPEREVSDILSSFRN